MSSDTEVSVPRISLIIPAFNEEQYIGSCLAAILENADGKFVEVLVIDNGSTDRTAEIAGSFVGVTVVREEKKGLLHARQRGYREAQGDILAYVDADTRMPPGWADVLHTQFATDDGLACISGPYEYYDIPARHRPIVMAWYWAAKPVYYLIGYMATGGNFAIRKSVLDAMGGFDTSISFYGEDTALAREAHRYGRVHFTKHLTMPTSGRRFKEHGYVHVAYDYFSNFLSVALRGKPVKQTYVDVR